MQFSKEQMAQFRETAKKQIAQKGSCAGITLNYVDDTIS